MLKIFCHILKSNKGFSLVEIVLFIVTSAILLGVTTNIMVGQVEAYSMLSHKQNTLSDARYAVSRIQNDLIRIPTGGLESISDTSINFIDSNGFSTSFSLSNGNLLRGADTLLESVASFTVQGLDSAGNETEVLSDVRKIKITITTTPVANEGSMSFSQTITPRIFVYNSYQ